MHRWKRHAILAACVATAFLLGRSDWNRHPPQGSTPGEARAGRQISRPMPTRPGETVAWLEGASLADCEALIANQGIKGLSPLLREALFLRLSELDPRRLGELIFELPANGRGMASWQTWITWLAKEHPETVDQLMAGRSFSLLQHEAIQQAIDWARYAYKGDPAVIFEQSFEAKDANKAAGALSQLAKTDPDLAINLLSKLMADGLPFPPQDPAFFRKLANANPAAMQELLPMARTPELRNMIASSLARVLAREDPAAAIQLYDSLSPSQARSSVAVEIAAEWAGRDATAALAWVKENMPEGAAKRKALAIALAPIADSDPRQVIQLLAGIRYGEASDMTSNPLLPEKVLETAVATLLRDHPLEALGMLHAGAADKASPAPVLSKALGTWFTGDPEAAISWLSSLSKEDRGHLIFRNDFTEWVKGMTPEAATAGAAMLARIEDRQYAASMVTLLAGAMGGQDLAAAIKAADDIPESLRTEWLSQAIQSHAQINPSAAAAEIHLLPEGQRSSAHLRVASQMIRDSPSRALGYLDGLAPEERTSWSYQSVVEQSGSASWPEIEAWWLTIPEDDAIARGGALAAIAERLYQSDPASVMNLRKQIAVIEEESIRVQAFEKLIQGMVPLDPDGARALAENPGMKLPGWASTRIKSSLEAALPKSKP